MRKFITKYQKKLSFFAFFCLLLNARAEEFDFGLHLGHVYSFEKNGMAIGFNVFPTNNSFWGAGVVTSYAFSSEYQIIETTPALNFRFHPSLILNVGGKLEIAMPNGGFLFFSSGSRLKVGPSLGAKVQVSNDENLRFSILPAFAYTFSHDLGWQPSTNLLLAMNF